MSGKGDKRRKCQVSGTEEELRWRLMGSQTPLDEKELIKARLEEIKNEKHISK